MTARRGPQPEPPPHPRHPAGSYGTYSCPCPRCGYPESRDDGPYDYVPQFDDALGGPPGPRVHLLWCGRCGKPFDAGPAAS